MDDSDGSSNQTPNDGDGGSTPAQQGDGGASSTPAQQQQDDGGANYTPAQQQDDGSANYTPAQQQDDGGGSTTPAQQQDDGGGSTTPAQQQDDGGGSTTPSQQQDDGGGSTTPSQQQGDGSANYTPAQQQDGGGVTPAQETDPATQAQALQAAGQDADAHAGTGKPGDPAAVCTNEPYCAPQDGKQSIVAQNVAADDDPGQLPGGSPARPGALEVTVVDAGGTAIAGASVNIQRPSQQISASTDASGKALFDNLIPDDYTVVASTSCCFSDFTVSGIHVPEGSSPSAGGTPVRTTVKLSPCDFVVNAPCRIVKADGGTVQITATEEQGCGAGTYAWTTSSTNITPQNANTPTVTVQGANPSTARDAETITVTRTCPGSPGCKPVVKTVNVTVARITSETAAASPANRDRTRIGVGERVQLTVSPVLDTWTVTAGATLSANSGATVQLIAGDRAATVTVTAAGSDCGCSIQFNIVEPSGMVAEQVPGTGVWHIQGTPSVGFRANWYVQPAEVSFEGITVREKHCAAVCDGYFKPQKGQDHVPGADVTLGPAVAGKGSPIQGTDTIQGGDGNIGPPYSNGTFTWPIPWEYQVGAGAPKVFVTMNHVKTIDGAGALTLSKGGVTVSKALNESNSGY